MPQDIPEGTIADGPNGPLVRRGGRWVPMNSQQGQVIADPTAPYEAPQAEAQARNTAAQANVNEATQGAQVRTAEAQATQAELEARAAQEEVGQLEDSQRAGRLRRIYRTDAILQSIRNARNIAREGGTGFESWFASLPATRARSLETELAPIMGNLAFDRLQEMRDESKTGGALGQVSERELDLLASTVASLDTGVDRETFLNRLDTIERHFINAQLAANNIDPYSDEGRTAMRRDFGYTGVFEDETQPDPTAELAGADEERARATLPEGYQNEHLRYLRDNWGNIDADSYVRFRSNLDEQYGQTPNLRAYADAVERYNVFAREPGSRPEQLGQVPAAPRARGTIERGLNSAATTAPGAFLANMGNAGSAGLASVLTGNQQGLDLLRETQPVASGAGELAGGITGSALTGGAYTAAGGGGRLATMLLPEVAYGSTYGATQDTDNPMRGALAGGISAAGGSLAGRALGRAFPSTFAPTASRQADEMVPTANDLREQAANEYADVQARGIAAMPDQTEVLADRINMAMADMGRVGPDGQYIGMNETPIRQARDLVEGFRGRQMTPTQAQTVRQNIGEGLGSPIRAEQALSARMMRDFDNWSEDVLPGIDVPNSTASRYLQGEQIASMAERGARRGARNTSGDEAQATRTMFGQMDERIADGRAMFRPEVEDQIGRVARGDGVTNALRWGGKFGLQNPITALGGGGLAGGIGYAAGGPVLGAAAGAGTALAGGISRNLAQRRTLRDAQIAELMALGGPEYDEALRAAAEMASNRGGRAVGGLFGSMGSQRTRN